MVTATEGTDMDPYVTGAMIKRLREKRNMTQQLLAVWFRIRVLKMDTEEAERLLRNSPKEEEGREHAAAGRN